MLVPVGGTEADKGTIQLACELANKDRAKIVALHVIVLERALPIEDEKDPVIVKAEGVLEHAEVVAEDQGYEIETSLSQAREVGTAIVEEAVGQDVDLILLGVRYHRRFGQFSLGDVVPYVLKNAPCRVMLYQQPTA